MRSHPQWMPSPPHGASMKHRRRMATGAAAALLIALPLLAAERLAVKTGLWENVTTLQFTGVTLPAEQLQRMTPEQRAQLEEMMKQMGVGAPRTDTDQSCVKEEDLDGRSFRESMQEAGEQCDFREVSTTSKRHEYTFQCRSEGSPTSGRLVIEVIDDSHVRGTMEATLPQGRMDMKFESRWKAAACGNVE
nr:MAG: hypothetical protein DIU62_11415 [Pseudomonadota bacterium]